mmetsp:Transcript_32928/g.67319  ORF Transcript_32928/g.67319 Transcript_32928/m.67319 type:complete len:254 (+) Transcript_32928:421-1182(+)
MQRTRVAPCMRLYKNKNPRPCVWPLKSSAASQHFSSTASAPWPFMLIGGANFKLSISHSPCSPSPVTCRRRRCVLPSSLVCPGPFPSDPFTTFTVKSSWFTLTVNSERPDRSASSMVADTSLLCGCHPFSDSYIHAIRSIASSPSGSKAAATSAPAAVAAADPNACSSLAPASVLPAGVSPSVSSSAAAAAATASCSFLSSSAFASASAFAWFTALSWSSPRMSWMLGTRVLSTESTLDVSCARIGRLSLATS